MQTKIIDAVVNHGKRVGSHLAPSAGMDRAYDEIEAKFRTHGRSLRTFEMDGGWVAFYSSMASSYSQTHWGFWGETPVAAAEGAWREFCEREGVDPAE